MKSILEKLRDSGIEVVYIDLDIDGYYSEEEKTIFINCNLSEIDQLKVIYHESGHGVLHDGLESIYKMPHFHSKIEYEADRYMLEQLIAFFLEKTEMDIEEMNIMHFMEYFEIPFGWELEVKEAFRAHYRESI